MGKKILSELIVFAKQAGYELLELEVAADNTAAVNLYKKMGFVVCGERPRSLKLKNGNYYDELPMVLDLTEQNSRRPDGRRLFLHKRHLFFMPSKLYLFITPKLVKTSQEYFTFSTCVI